VKTREEQLKMVHSILMSCGLVGGRQPAEGTQYRCPLCGTLSVLNADLLHRMKSHHTGDCIVPKMLRESMTEGDYSLYAFWKYDQFPYVMGGPVGTFLKNGGVTVRGYPGELFTPIKIVPWAAGVELHAMLNEVKEEYRQAQQKILEDALRKLDKAAPWATGKVA
jgi:hypothetical protein